MTETLIQRLKRHEGYRLKPYLDTTGNYTIGYGHKLTDDQAQEYANGISEIDAEQLLDADINKARVALAQDLPWALDLPRFRQDILTELVFQLGVNGLLTFKNLLYCARCGDQDGVAHAMLDSLWHKQTPARCEELAALWLSNA